MLIVGLIGFFAWLFRDLVVGLFGPMALLGAWNTFCMFSLWHLAFKFGESQPWPVGYIPTGADQFALYLACWVGLAAAGVEGTLLWRFTAWAWKKTKL